MPKLPTYQSTGSITTATPSIKSDIKLNGLLICGETFYYDTLKFIISKIAPKHLFNCYGSTELSPWVFSYKFNPEDLNHIKKIGLVPIGPGSLLILDDIHLFTI